MKIERRLHQPKADVVNQYGRSNRTQYWLTIVAGRFELLRWRNDSLSGRSSLPIASIIAALLPSGRLPERLWGLFSCSQLFRVSDMGHATFLRGSIDGVAVRVRVPGSGRDGSAENLLFLRGGGQWTGRGRCIPSRLKIQHRWANGLSRLGAQEKRSQPSLLE